MEIGWEMGIEERGLWFVGWLFFFIYVFNCLECMDYDIFINLNESFLLFEIKCRFRWFKLFVILLKLNIEIVY